MSAAVHSNHHPAGTENDDDDEEEEDGRRNCYCCPYSGFQLFPMLFVFMAWAYTISQGNSGCDVLRTEWTPELYDLLNGEDVQDVIDAETTLFQRNITNEIVHIGLSDINIRPLTKPKLENLSQTYQEEDDEFDYEAYFTNDALCVSFAEDYEIDSALRFARAWTGWLGFVGFVLLVLVFVTSCRRVHRTTYYLPTVMIGCLFLSTAVLFKLIVFASDICNVSDCTRGTGATNVFNAAAMWCLTAGALYLLPLNERKQGGGGPTRTLNHNNTTITPQTHRQNLELQEEEEPVFPAARIT